jgi:hypothetical protein
MKVVIQKPDLDTCMAGHILGIGPGDEVIMPAGETPEGYLADPAVLCIEVGGSGQVALGNFDHHDPGRYLLPACRQAMVSKGVEDERVTRLVDYVCAVDEVSGFEKPPVRPTLSDIFSGMLFVAKDPSAQFFKGVEILGRVLVNGVDPFGPMPDLPEWQEYRDAKEKQSLTRAEALNGVSYFQTRSGRKAGYLKSEVIGGAGGIFHRGCDIAVLYNPCYGNPPRRKFTIAGKGIAVTEALQALNALEPGWGGRQYIIGSPWGGTLLVANKVMEVVVECL